MKLSAVSVVSKVGVVILTTALSFAVRPPTLGRSENVVTWSNVFSFFAGTVCVLIWSKLNSAERPRRFGFSLVAVLIVLIGIYEMLYFRNSVDCFDGRVVISSAAPKTDQLQQTQRRWQHDQQTFSETQNCDSLEIWNMSDLALPYYGMLVTYFLILLVLTVLLVYLSDLIGPAE